MERLQSFIGIFAILFIAWLFSENKKIIKFKTIITGLLIQFAFLLLLLKLSLFKEIFLLLDKAVSSLQMATEAGTSFVFGYLGGAPLPFEEKMPGSSFVLALRALPLVLVVSAITSVLFYWRILPYIVLGFSWLLKKSMGIGGAVGLGAAANVFLGMVEAPLFIKPYLSKMTRCELFTTMSCGMAGIAGTVMVLYATILKNVVPDAMGHILTVSIITIPAAIVISEIMVPETGNITEGDVFPENEAKSTMDAITRGTQEGIELLINIIAMLIVLVALVHLVNTILSLFPPLFGKPVTLQRILGWLMSPVVFLIGIPWQEAQTAGALMGTKTILNEFIAYLDMAKLPPDTLSERSRLIMTYALCGFANFGSLGIMIGGMGAMAPDRKPEIVELGIKSIVAGTLATLMAGALVGVIF